ncbi:hypothetical protein B5807_04729 [Epicoccum nigrum]|uniref:Aminoglycoside phosphotransferase domain-containing protein n=1 Tax=Epicoccum nigrum TaxID=105696 RepID=A0A1Y2M2A1_EPING|nr:hypothetical protein B5807_04729 [Epicoccum nigrum]
MEKLCGQPIGDNWYNLSEQQRLQVLHDIVKLESKLFSIQLPASGSIYYTRDLDRSTPKVNVFEPNGQFCVGSYTGLRWWYGKRAELKLDRGPHIDTLRVLRAPAEKELSWIRAYAQPRYPFHRQYREAFQYKKQDSAIHTASLEKYLCAAPHLVPENPELNLPTLRHPDIQPNNIFRDKDYRVTGLVDWQHATALPAFLAAGLPSSFQNYSDPESVSFAPPRLPIDLDSLDEAQRAQADEQFRRRQRALEQEPDLLRGRIFDHVGEPWDGLNTTLHHDLVQIARNWDKIALRKDDGAARACPVSFTQKEIDQIDALEESHRDADGDVEQINEFLGIASDGWTPNERFESAKDKAAEIREQALASADNDP